MNPKLRVLIEKCLEVNAAKRSCPKDLLEDPDIFEIEVPRHQTTVINSGDLIENQKVPTTICKFFRSSQLTLEFEGRDVMLNEKADQNFSNESSQSKLNDNAENGSTVVTPLTADHLSQRNLKEVYYLWQLAGGDVFAELKRQGLTRKKPAVLSLPWYIKFFKKIHKT